MHLLSNQASSAFSTLEGLPTVQVTAAISSLSKDMTLQYLPKGLEGGEMKPFIAFTSGKKHQKTFVYKYCLFWQMVWVKLNPGRSSLAISWQCCTCAKASPLACSYEQSCISKDWRKQPSRMESETLVAVGVSERMPRCPNKCERPFPPKTKAQCVRKNLRETFPQAQRPWKYFTLVYKYLEILIRERATFHRNVPNNRPLCFHVQKLVWSLSYFSHPLCAKVKILDRNHSIQHSEPSLVMLSSRNFHWKTPQNENTVQAFVCACSDV